VLKILSNTIVDLVKISSDNKQSDFELKFFQAKLKPSLADKMGEFIRDRLLTVISDCDMVEESDKKSYFYLIRKMINADFMDNLDIVRMKFKLEKDGKFTEERKVLFDRIMQEK
jgi:hypothetical protein